MKRLPSFATQRSILGISLIEVLVSLVILSLGVLAVVALQLVAKRNNADAGQRTIAAQLAYDMLERMRANCAPARLNEYRTADNSPLGRGSLSAPSQNCASADCTTAQLVTYDRWQWEQTLDGAAEKKGTANTGGLVLPTACISGPAGGGDGLYTVTIVWRGTVGIPPEFSGVATDATRQGCGRNLQIGGEFVYGDGGNNDRLRRSVSVPSFITARTT